MLLKIKKKNQKIKTQVILNQSLIKNLEVDVHLWQAQGPRKIQI
jgi:hypothetical protein